MMVEMSHVSCIILIIAILSSRTAERSCDKLPYDRYDIASVTFKYGNLDRPLG